MKGSIDVGGHEELSSVQEKNESIVLDESFDMSIFALSVRSSLKQIKDIVHKNKEKIIGNPAIFIKKEGSTPLSLEQIHECNARGVDVGIMVGHMILPGGPLSNKIESIYNKFVDGIACSDYVVTDDLGMYGHKKSTGMYEPDKFYTTDLVLAGDNVMKLDLGKNVYIQN